jgi:hypothetical protein
MKTGQHIPGFRLQDPDDLARRATVTASSRLRLEKLSANGPLISLTQSHAQMLPLPAGRVPAMTFLVHTDAPTTLRFELRTSSRPDNHTPDVVLATKNVELREGQNQHVTVDFGVNVETPRYVFVCLTKNEHVRVHGSQQRVTGVLSVRHTRTQKPQHDIGVETFEMWCPARRPGGHNFTFILDAPLDVFAPQNVTNGAARPTNAPNAWVADFDDPQPTLTLQWERPQTIARVDLSFDTDWDHAMETVLMGHPENAIPFCVRHARVRDAAGKVVTELTDNHQTRRALLLKPAVTTDKLTIELLETWGQVPAALFEVRCYETSTPSSP